MKIYISLPITGRDIDQVRADIKSASDVIKGKGHVPVSPLDEAVNPDLSANYSRLLGNDIEALLACDAILCLPGHETSKGCDVEKHAAGVYSKRIFLDAGEIPARNKDND